MNDARPNLHDIAGQDRATLQGAVVGTTLSGGNVDSAVMATVLKPQ